ncbi:MAG: hypothetical protein IAE87_15700 [Rhodobacteraceae bacterium]|jgi:hypothetical protein|nr:hypothetical protein [Paracoccaceae bacterium]
MSEFRKALTEMRRPGLLMRAVRHGLRDYSRSRGLRQPAGDETAMETRLSRLMEAEARLESTRRAGHADYSIARHIEVLVALIAEARPLFAEPRPLCIVPAE